MEFVWWILIAVLFLLGFAGLLIPILPDAPFLFLGFLIYHFLIHPDSLSMSFWIVVMTVMAMIVITDYIAGWIVIQSYRGSLRSIPAAIVRFIRQRDWKEALKVGVGTLAGCLGSVIVKGVLMAGLLIWFFILLI
ncbi:DUF456 family protein [Melghirimyces algeriensis]|uniref:Uncharacterized conserved protein YqgC, DUF456 family n=1 Tax=Melghirimyces algeriensis TaxID=910412 RepID=A0A521CAG5_9BACL|nr:DUF456 family protein [Melghirimyces algeriensis]SMO56388.1 Uncharacterized conserved protein YqgC, DUF456 family [Melghirimyces algeriensis]